MIRLFAPADLPAIEDIYAQAVAQGLCTADLTPPPRERWNQWLECHRAPRFPAFVACEEDLVTGYCTLSPYRPGREALAGLAEISYYVDPNHQRRGIASALIRHCEAWAREHGFRHLLAIVIDANQASLELLQRHGFEEWGRLPEVLLFEGCPHDHVYLGKPC